MNTEASPNQRHLPAPSAGSGNEVSAKGTAMAATNGNANPARLPMTPATSIDVNTDFIMFELPLINPQAAPTPRPIIPQVIACIIIVLCSLPELPINVDVDIDWWYGNDR